MMWSRRELLEWARTVAAGSLVLGASTPTVAQGGTDAEPAVLGSSRPRPACTSCFHQCNEPRNPCGIAGNYDAA